MSVAERGRNCAKQADIAEAGQREAAVVGAVFSPAPSRAQASLISYRRLQNPDLGSLMLKTNLDL